MVRQIARSTTRTSDGWTDLRFNRDVAPNVKRGGVLSGSLPGIGTSLRLDAVQEMQLLHG
jgi:hypothetical protein